MKTIYLFLFLFFTCTLKAGDIRGGDIRIEQLSPFTVRATINLNLVIHSDISLIEICWGDGSCEFIQPQQNWEFPEIDTRQQLYSTLHTYFQHESYTVSVIEDFWSNDLLNMPGAETQPFELAATFELMDPNVAPLNTMPPMPDPLITGNIGNFITYAATSSDENLSVQFCEPNIDSYVRPDDIFSSQNSEIILDTLDGGFIWAIPQVEGFFMLTLCSSEYRNGTLISQTTRHITIIVDGAVSTNSLEKPGFSLKVFPNPASEEILLTYDFHTSEEIEIALNNTSGSIKPLLAPLKVKGKGQIRLNVSEFSTGTYLLLIKSKNGMEAIPLMIF